MKEAFEHYQERQKVIPYYKWIFWCILVPAVVVDFVITQHTHYAATWAMWLVNYVWAASISAFVASLIWLLHYLAQPIYKRHGFHLDPWKKNIWNWVCLTGICAFIAAVVSGLICQYALHIIG
jgi:hypothetical protein